MKLTPEVMMFIAALDEQGVRHESIRNAISVTTERLERQRMTARMWSTMRKVDRRLNAILLPVKVIAKPMKADR